MKKSPTENDNELGLLSQSNRPTEWIDNTISGGFENYSSKFEQQVYGEFNMENDYFLRSDIIRDILNSSNFIWLPLQQIKKSLKLERHANWTSADQSGTTFGCEWCWIQFSTNKSRCRSHEEVFHFERKWHTRESNANSSQLFKQFTNERALWTNCKANPKIINNFLTQSCGHYCLMNCFQCFENFLINNDKI